MLTFLTIAGGVALIFFGVRYLHKGLDRLFGPQLQRWMQRLTRSRLRAFGAGFGLSLAAPSSTTIAILAVQAVQAGQLTAQRMLALILGANIGLTLMVVLMALRIEQYAPVMILAGVALFQLGRSSTTRGSGQLILSLGFIFLAIGMIKQAGAVVEPNGDVAQLLAIAQQYPIWIAIAAALLTVAVQSSTTALGLVVGLGAGNLVNLDMALAAVIGSNVGMGVSMLIMGWHHHESRRLALGNLAAKGTIAVAALATLPLLIRGLQDLPLRVDQAIAVMHTGFNVMVGLAFLPLTGLLYGLLLRVLPPPSEDELDPYGPRYIRQRPAAEGFSLSIGQSRREVLRVSEIVRQMLDSCWRALAERNEVLAREVQQRDDQVDMLDSVIKRYLTELANQASDDHESAELMRQLRYLSELEAIGDVIDKNLAELAVKRARQRITFSEEGWRELEDFFNKVKENLLIAETAFATHDVALAEKLLRHKECLSVYERELRDRHFNRLKAGHAQTHDSTAVHLDVLTHLKRINNAVTHVAYAVLEKQRNA